MKQIRIIISGIFLIVASFKGSPANAQEFEIQQLLLDVEKLAQLKHILNDLYEGYQIVSGGYNAIKDISKGTFDLHATFLDGLLAVSPVVKNYKRVADIINVQLQIVSEYKGAFKRFKQGGSFSIDELTYLDQVYSNLFNQSLKNLDELLLVTTASTLRMSDDERLQAIDRIYGDVKNKLNFLRAFNNSTTVLALQRAHDRNDNETIKGLYGVQ